MELLLFADNKTILGKNAIDLQNILGTLEEYCEINGLIVNTEKTKLMRFKKGSRGKPKEV